MKVLQLTTTPRPFFDQQVRALEERGVECTTLPVPGAHTGASSRSGFDYLRYYPQVLRRSHEYDLVHANFGLVAPFALAQPTRPIVLTLWGTDLMGPPWLRNLSAGSARRFDAVVLPSRAMEEYIDCGHVIVPFGVDMDVFRPIPQADAREHVGWETDERIVLFPYDRERPEKDFERARRTVERARVDADLRTITGVPHEEVPYYMNASDALLVTSKRESGPMVVKEAAACNLPVVSTDVGFVRETIADVDNSAVCTTTDELVDALEYVLRRREPSNGRDAIDGLGVDAMGDSLVELYEAVLTGGRRRSRDRRATP